MLYVAFITKNKSGVRFRESLTIQVPIKKEKKLNNLYSNFYAHKYKQGYKITYYESEVQEQNSYSTIPSNYIYVKQVYRQWIIFFFTQPNLKYLYICHIKGQQFFYSGSFVDILKLFKISTVQIFSNK